MYLTLLDNFRIMLRLMKSNGCVPLLCLYTKIYNKCTIYTNKLILTPSSPSDDIKCKKLKPLMHNIPKWSDTL